MRSLRFLPLLLALTAPPLAAQSKDTRHVTAQEARIDSVRVAVARYCATSKPASYLCVTQAILGRAASAETAFVAQQGTPATPPVTPPVVPQPPVTPSVPPTSAAPIGVPTGSVLAELPRVEPSHSYPSGGHAVAVPAGADLQAMLNAAQGGDVLLLPSCSTWVGSLTWPARADSGVVVIRTNVSLPAEGTRMTPTLAKALCLAKIVSPDPSPAIQTAPGAHGWRLSGVEVTATGAQSVNYGLITFGSSNPTTAPSQLGIDRSYVHGTPTLQLSRCLALNSANSFVVDSWLEDCHSKGNDSQAIGGWNGAGPFLIQNNYLDGAAQSVMFGGADPSVPNLVPSDITIRGNHMTRPVSWTGVWTEKTIVELKNARRVLVEGNVIEHTWVDGQVGFGVLLKAVNQGGSAPWSTTQDVTVRYNRISGVGAVFNLAAHPEQFPVVPAARFTIYDNVADSVNVGPYAGSGNELQVLGDVADVIFVHNAITAPAGNAATMFDGSPNTRLVFHSNVQSTGSYCYFGSSHGAGAAALSFYAPSGLIANNVLVGSSICGASIPTNVQLTAWPTTMPAGYDGRVAGPDLVKVTAATTGAVVAP